MACADDQSKFDAQQTQGLQKSLCGHPLFFGITTGLHSEIINSRYLFPLSPHLHFNFKRYDPSYLGIFWVHKAVDACKNVLRGLHSNKITERELDRVSY
ncbi:hypothetical protein JHK82_050696 [Glycine max]|uniref:Uncharacterized protein n=2 Tax=Glycine subgen. Soja TaxID=1462606 RepID=K7MSV3_SOYBN|nr:hypothetical protein JHK86_050562 [Glycine max]KAG4924841.1 hypothetical protein JHK87_050381 [Glycine soja]KAG4936485.1 hypothetical protein JHK85_051404 [Glycine max]KAG5091918.1 hypothetical protein JHK82_050696 [Glycine max]KAG5095011.1 hypothetical protein JHK84_050599 [Glycine max]